MTTAKFNQCLKSIRAEDRHGIEEFYNRFYKKMVFTALSIVKSWEAAEDVASSFIAYVLEYADKIPYVNNPIAWISRSINNLAIDYIRKNSRAIKYEGYEMDTFMGSQDKYEINRTVIDIFNKLTISEQQLVQMHFIYGLKYREISKETKIPVGTIKSRIHAIRAKIQLSKNLDVS